MNILFQKTSASIGDVVSNLLNVINAYKKAVNSNSNTIKSVLCKNITFRLEEKFLFELNSPVYAVASFSMFQNSVSSNLFIN